MSITADRLVKATVIHSHACRNEYFLLAHIYAQHGILTHGLPTLSAIIAQFFPSFW